MSWKDINFICLHSRVFFFLYLLYHGLMTWLFKKGLLSASKLFNFKNSYPKSEDLIKCRPPGRTLVCCNIQGWHLIWSEKLTVSGNSWFSLKFIQVNRKNLMVFSGGRALCSQGGPSGLIKLMKTSNTSSVDFFRETRGSKVVSRGRNSFKIL